MVQVRRAAGTIWQFQSAVAPLVPITQVLVCSVSIMVIVARMLSTSTAAHQFLFLISHCSFDVQVGSLLQVPLHLIILFGFLLDLVRSEALFQLEA